MIIYCINFKEIPPKETQYQTLPYYPKNEYLPHLKDAYTPQSNYPKHQPNLINIKKQEITQKLLQPVLNPSLELSKNVKYIDNKNSNQKEINDKINNVILFFYFHVFCFFSAIGNINKQG